MFASRLIRTSISSLNTHTSDTSYYNYSNGRVIRDSSLLSPYSYIYKFAYQSGTLELNGRAWIIPSSYSFTDYSKIYQTKINDKLIYQIDTVKRHVDTSAVSQYYVTETEVSYLNNPNPFYKFSPVKREYFTDMGNGSPYAVDSYFPKNLVSEQNLTRKSWESNHPENVKLFSNEHIKYEYAFRVDGYPLEARSIMQLNTTYLREKMLFIYQQ
jgi:hypothetical protein